MCDYYTAIVTEEPNPDTGLGIAESMVQVWRFRQTDGRVFTGDGGEIVPSKVEVDRPPTLGEKIVIVPPNVRTDLARGWGFGESFDAAVEVARPFWQDSSSKG